MNDAAVVIRRLFSASRERLFRAWSDPLELILWFSPAGYGNPSVDAEVRPGGNFRYLRQLGVALPSIYGPTADDNPFA